MSDAQQPALDVAAPAPAKPARGGATGERPAQAAERPVARVAVDVSLSHLDRPFDYRVLPAQHEDAVPGARVRVRFAGKLRDGFILERLDASEHDGTLAPLHKIISAEPVLTPAVARLIRRVADHYAGCFADVLRLAVPPRHAATEAEPRRSAATEPVEGQTGAPQPDPIWATFPDGPGLLAALRDGRNPRAVWRPTPSTDPSGDWATGFAEAAAATVAGGRGAILIVPDRRDLDRLAAACAERLGERSFVQLTAELGPSARYRSFLAALRGDVPVVIGTRAAAFAPVRDLGLVGVWDDGDDLLSEQRAPYPHTRDVLALRAVTEPCAVLVASYGRSVEVQSWLESGWAHEVALERTSLRRLAPRVKVTADSDSRLERDPLARALRLPREAFEVIRTGLTQGPVLVQVPRAGYLLALICQTCREPVRCQFCGGPTRQGPGDQPASCTWCGRLQADWACPICGGRRLRAPVVGAERTAEELGRAFSQTPVRRSAGGSVLSEVGPDSAIVVTTPGAEPYASDGYAAALLLDTSILLLRPDLRAAEEALRRWFNATALVRPGGDGGTVLAVGESSGRALQALVRLDAAGFAARELAERGEAHFPPAVKLITAEGRREALDEFVALAQLPDGTELLGPVELPEQSRLADADEPVWRLTLRGPRAFGDRLARAAKEVAAIRSARKSEGGLRLRVDPQIID
ncbi:primosomal protein N' [Microlunatus parietis]|uniref:Probable replication restart protein PriA n=1 Tax=Microlunatus parietis TaxID=682979 RepID=A0A7Y9I2S0_9ACTN|nr:primosomal protein N' [Microlunatus parietis]NYE69057.1 primosomal protein N' (replication factor Y) [Microlunatus parietis]